jgi:hypothetical protein
MRSVELPGVTGHHDRLSESQIESINFVRAPFFRSA